jgi:hypothetical protein
MGVNDPAFAVAQQTTINSWRLLKVRPRERAYQPFQFEGECEEEVEDLGAGARRLIRLLETAPVLAMGRPKARPASKADAPPGDSAGEHAPEAPCGAGRRDGQRGTTIPSAAGEEHQAAPAAAPPDTARPLPRWDSAKRELRYGEILCWGYTRAAGNQMCVLDAFEKAGWPESIPNPLRRGSLRQTVCDMRKDKGKDSPIVFQFDGDRNRVSWRERPRNDLP